MNLRNKKVSVIGLGSSGKFAAKLAYDLGARVGISELEDTSLTRENLSAFRKQEINIEIGRHTREFIRGSDLIITSPGVSSQASIIKWAEELNIPIISEIELGYWFCQAPIIAITGTNGKTTVTTLIGQILKTTGRQTFVCGNIGEPFTKIVSQTKNKDLVCLEVSSFQLERIEKFRPRVAIILNITPDHLDRHIDMKDYLAAKKRIFLNQGQNDWTLLNYQDKILRSLSDQTKAKVLFFNKQSSSNPNFEAALIATKLFGVDSNIAQKVFEEFKGLPHRLEHIANINGVEFINDSKATNVSSTVWALNAITKPIVLIAGGRDKGADFGQIQELIKSKVKNLVIIGEARQKIKSALSSAVSIEEADTLSEATSLAFKKAKTGDCILLSPMCASFDMFLNYQQRGDVFRKQVLSLKGS